MINRLKILLRVSVFWLVLFFINRLIFTFYNTTEEESVGFLEFLKAAIYGLRMDLSLAGYILVVVALIFALSTYTKLSGRVVNWFHYVLIPVMVILLSVDLIIFSFWRSHFDSSAFIYMDRVDVITMSLTAWQAIAAALMMILYLFVAFVLFRYIVQKHSEIKEKQKWYLIPVWLFIIATMIIPIRGGLQHIPMNTGVAYFSNNGFANMVAVNPVWNFAYSMKRYKQLNATYRYIDSAEAAQIFDDLYATNGEPEKVLNTERPNIVIVMLESFAEGVIDYEKDGKHVTPMFNALKKEGIYFKNIYGTNTRSDKGIVGILSGSPVLPGISLLKYPQKSKTLTFLPKILKDAGYRNMSFIYGGDINFANMNSYVHMAGFENIYSKSDFPSEYYNKKWGVHDEYAFDFLLEDMTIADSAFFKVFFTLSSHEPFDVPMERVFADDYLNSIHYTDRCIGDFIASAKQLNSWDSSLFIFLSDHSSGWPQLPNSHPERYHIPMLWAGGALNVKDTVIEKIASQTDLSVSLLSQINLNKDGFKFSKDIFNPQQKGFAFFNHNGGFFYLDGTVEQYYDIQYNDYYTFKGSTSRSDSLKAKAYIQTLFEDYENR